jgi:Lysyl oxidase
MAGEFVYYANHGHVHFDGFATYDLKLTDATGNIVASGGKTSFCLINIRQPLPDVTANAGLVHGRGGNSCGQIQGISAGYSDVYSAPLDDQCIDVTNVANGQYWLEIAADPENRIVESNGANNTARVLIRLENGRVTF